MQAITVKYLGPTNTKGARYKAICDAGAVIVSYDYGKGIVDNIRAAVEALVIKLNWQWFESYTLGQMANGDYVALAACSYPTTMVWSSQRV